MAVGFPTHQKGVTKNSFFSHPLKMAIIDARSLLSSSRDRDSVLAHVHLAEFKLLRKGMSQVMVLPV